ncbi:unnamed protein product [Brassica oleracea var. botrytis]|uniref:(rape) hypothetical protein n=1 Tax=Brassica napus TaxID=3708 RepID=A0A816IG64_BRANA|nr:unnamed protein product [Brassica napus]
MVKRPVEGKDKATTRRSRKELICDLRQPWLQEQYRPLTLAPNIGHLTAEARLNGDFIMHQAGKRKGKEICKIVSSTGNNYGEHPRSQH